MAVCAYANGRISNPDGQTVELNRLRIMLEYVKLILSKVCFDKILFEKELIKGLKVLKRDELLQLKKWCRKSFPDMHLIINRVFAISSERYA